MKTAIQRLDDFISQHSDAVNSNIIYTDDGDWVLFERYRLIKNDDTYVLLRHADEYSVNFSSAKNAVAWAILDKYNKFYERNRVADIDIKLQSLELEQQIHRKLSKHKDNDVRTINILKYQQDRHAKRTFRAELDKYINMAKYWQQRGFENELTRIARKQKDQSVR